MKKKLLTLINDYITEYMKGEKCDITILKGINLTLKAEYIKYIKVNGRETFLKFVKQNFKDDFELTFLCFSILYQATQEDVILRYMYEVVYESKVDVFVKLMILYGINRWQFVSNARPVSYKYMRQLYAKLVDDYKEILPTPINKIPVEERDQKEVVITTNQFLGRQHAPTNIICFIALQLIEQFGFKVSIVVSKTNSNLKDTQCFVDCAYEGGRDDVKYGQFDIEGHNVTIYNVPFAANTVEDMNNMLGIISKIKPIFAWYIGGNSIIGDLIGGLTTSISMPCIYGYSVQNAEYMISYMNDNSQRLQDLKKVLTDNGQVPLEINSAFSSDGDTDAATIERSEIGCASDDFIICISGNRLEVEVTCAFLEMLQKVREESEAVKILFIGDVAENKQEEINGYLGNQAIYLGFRNDLELVIGATSCFVNPPRQGGGGGARISINNGLPVVTLGDCDCAYRLSQEMRCGTLEEMKDKIVKLYKDKEYYQKESDAVLEIRDKRRGLTLKDEMYKIIKTVNEMSHLGLDNF